jgi:hypothetical protein
VQQGLKPNELVRCEQEGAGSVGAVKRAGGTDEGDGVIHGFGGEGKLRCGWVGQVADHGGTRCGNGEAAVGYKGMADIRLRSSGDAKKEVASE